MESAYMESFEKFSVIIPLYNKEIEIERSINSVLSQTIKSFELIVIDDGSTDGGPAKVKEFKDPRIKIISQQNSGVSAARNRGIRAANNGLIAFLDADDQWETNYLETILRMRQNFPDSGLYATNYRIKSRQGYFKKPNLMAIPDSPWEGIIPNYFRSSYLGMPPVFTSATTIPKQVLNEVGLFKEGEILGEDIDLWARIALNFSICFSRRFCSVYYLDSNNRACLKNIPNSPFPFIRTATRMIKTEQCNTGSIQYLKEYVAKLEFQRVRQHIIAGNNLEAIKILSTITTKRVHLILLLYLWAFIPYKVNVAALKFKNKILMRLKTSPDH